MGTALSLVGGGTLLAAFLLRKRVQAKCGVHDDSNEEDVLGKVVLITGANSGLGKEASYEMAKRGAIVIMASSNLELTKQVAKELEEKTGNKELHPMKLDLSSLKEIRDFVEEFKKKFQQIDILINNAGVFVPIKKRLMTKDDFELNLGINHLGHFLLTNLLLDLVKKGAPSRIVIVASTLAEKGQINFEDLMMKNDNGDKDGRDPRFTAYANSKLANMLFCKELANRVAGNGVQVYALCPGWVKTNLARYMDLNWKSYLFMLLPALMFMRSNHQGVQTILHCSLSKECANETGKIYRDCKLWVPKVSLTDATAKKLWEVSEELVGLKK